MRFAKLVQHELLGDQGLGRRSLACSLPLLADGLAEEVGEIVRVGGADDVSLVALGLEPLLGRVREVDRLQMEGTLGSNGLEDDRTLLRRHLSVRLVLDYKARDVLDDGANGLNIALRVLDNDSDLRSSNAETPETLAVTVDETSQRLLDLFKVETEAVQKVELRTDDQSQGQLSSSR